MVDVADLESGSINPFDDLLDELLVEILCRLPCSNNAVRCKCVCKRWLALISHPYYISCFIFHKTQYGIRKMVSEANEDGNNLITHHQQHANKVPFSIVYNPHRLNFFAPGGISNKGILMYVDEETASGFCGFSVNYPPWCEPDGELPMTVYGACNDLLLCCSNAAQSRDYRLYNPRTGQYLQLPDPPCRQIPQNMGLMCDPYYSFIDEGQRSRDVVILNASYRFYAACFRIPGKSQSHNQMELEVEIFSSETWGWKEIVLSSPKPILLDVCYYQVFVHRGMLYTYSTNGILGFDPRESDHEGVGVIRGHFIDWPEERVGGISRYKLERFSVTESHLVFSQFDTTGTLSVWEHEDQDRYAAAAIIWSLKYKLCLKELVSHDSILCEYAENLSDKIWLLGFHPSCKDIIYLQLDRHYLSFNLRERVLKVVSRAPKDRLCSKYFWLVYPWWPTPMRTICTGC